MTTHHPHHPHASTPRVHPVLRAGAALVLEVRELGRRAGAMTRVARTVPAPSGMASIGSQVPADAQVRLELRLESVLEGVLVTGTATVGYQAECSRCLDPVQGEVQVDLTELYVYPDTDARGRVRPRAAGDVDDEESAVVDDLIDIEPVLRDAIVLGLPVAPVCGEGCPGLCPQCGYRLQDDPRHHHDQVDARWAALAPLLGTPTDEKEEG